MAPLLVFSRGIFRFLSGPWKTRIGTSRVFVIRVESVDSIFSSWVDIAQNRRKDSSLKFYWKQKFLLRNIAAHCVQFSQVSGWSELDNTVDRILPMYRLHKFRDLVTKQFLPRSSSPKYSRGNRLGARSPQAWTVRGTFLGRKTRRRNGTSSVDFHCTLC